MSHLFDAPNENCPYMNLLWFENLLLMRLWVWNAYLVLLWNRALALRNILMYVLCIGLPTGTIAFWGTIVPRILTVDHTFKGVFNCQNSRDKGPPEGNSARG